MHLHQDLHPRTFFKVQIQPNNKHDATLGSTFVPCRVKKRSKRQNSSRFCDLIPKRSVLSPTPNSPIIVSLSRSLRSFFSPIAMCAHRLAFPLPRKSEKAPREKRRGARKKRATTRSESGGKKLAAAAKKGGRVAWRAGRGGTVAERSRGDTSAAVTPAVVVARAFRQPRIWLLEGRWVG
uniref:Uncharacterized protein n=1 Tax=Bursaphelenchus xylophilus TaxID=6326 RepID=A0A1I7SJN3_BURXY